MGLIATLVAVALLPHCAAVICGLETEMQYCLGYVECRWNSCGYCSNGVQAAAGRRASPTTAGSGGVQYDDPCNSTQVFVEIDEPGWQACEDNAPASDNGTCLKSFNCPERWPLEPVRLCVVCRWGCIDWGIGRRGVVQWLPDRLLCAPQQHMLVALPLHALGCSCPLKVGVQAW